MKYRFIEILISISITNNLGVFLNLWCLDHSGFQDLIDIWFSISCLEWHEEYTENLKESQGYLVPKFRLGISSSYTGLLILHQATKPTLI